MLHFHHLHMLLIRLVLNCHMCVLSQLFLDMLYNHMNYKNNIHSIQFQYMLDPLHHDELNHVLALVFLLHFHNHIHYMFASCFHLLYVLLPLLLQIHHMYELSVILFLHSYIHASDLLYHLTNQ